MEKLSMCRICLCKNVTMCFIANTNLQEIYEKLMEAPFETDDCRPLQVCYNCNVRLLDCYELRNTCFESEGYFTQMIVDNQSLGDNSPKVEHCDNVNIVPVALNNSSDIEANVPCNDIKVESSEIADYVQLEEEPIEGIS